MYVDGLPFPAPKQVCIWKSEVDGSWVYLLYVAGHAVFMYLDKLAYEMLFTL